MARLTDLLPSRRDVLQWGGVALASTWVDGLVWPLDIRAAGTTNPRGTARHCIFIELGGAISPMDCWDFKETRWTPKDLRRHRSRQGPLHLAHALPAALGADGPRGARAVAAGAELIHFNGQDPARRDYR